MLGVYSCDIVNTKELAESIYSITIKSPDIVQNASAGQFINVKCGQERLLRRPLSISRIEGDTLMFVFEVKGNGTQWLSERKTGDCLDILGPLGNGFSIPPGNIIVVGGGIGVPPLLMTAESAGGDVTAILGFRDSSRVIMKSDFDAVCTDVIITTDDGSSGIKGTVLSPLEKQLISKKHIAVLACGPKAMLSAVANLCNQYGIPTQVSLEERMACGIGACVVCACATIINDTQSMSRVCKDGPVFNATQVCW
jgi:dihydroorotate dehydrogenase electron transfer subunit